MQIGTLIFLIFWGWGVAGEMAMSAQGCPIQRQDYLGCVANLTDLNGDGQVTQSEFLQAVSETFSPHQLTHLKVLQNTTWVWERCDSNADNVLTDLDWIASAATCVNSPFLLQMTCTLCINKGYAFH